MNIGDKVYWILSRRIDNTSFAFEYKHLNQFEVSIREAFIRSIYEYESERMVVLGISDYNLYSSANINDLFLNYEDAINEISVRIKKGFVDFKLEDNEEALSR